MAFTRFRRNQGSCERFPTRNALYDIVMGLVATTLPLKVPGYRDEIESTSAIHGRHVNIIATNVEGMSVRPTRPCRRDAFRCGKGNWKGSEDRCRWFERKQYLRRAEQQLSLVLRECCVLAVGFTAWVEQAIPRLHGETSFS